MDPHHNQRGTRDQLNPGGNTGYNRDSTAGASGGAHTADGPDRDAPDAGNPQDRQPRHSDGFTIIPPNESRRNKMKMMAQKEEEDLQRWKEANRVPSVHLNPERLGGAGTLDEARQKQYADLRCSKVQKKMRKEDLDKKKRQEEEEELQRMKAERRRMAECLEERRRQEEQRRREQFRQDHLRSTESFLRSLERSAPHPLASGSATHTSSTIEAGKQREGSKSVREIQLEHKRVNSAFLDKLEARGRGSDKDPKEESIRQAEYPCFDPEDFLHPQLPRVHLDPDAAEQRCSGWTEKADREPDYDWALMKLINRFPDCTRVFLEDILNQCDGDYDQAYTLLISALS